MLHLLLLLTLFQLPQKESNLCAKTAEELPRTCGDESNTKISADGYDYVCTWVCVGRAPTKWELDSVTIKRKRKILPPEVWHEGNATVFISRQAAVKFGAEWEKETRDGLNLCASTVSLLPRSCHTGQWLSTDNGGIFLTRPKKGMTCDWACEPEKNDTDSYWGIRAGPWSLDTMGYGAEQP